VCTCMYCIGLKPVNTSTMLKASLLCCGKVFQWASTPYHWPRHGSIVRPCWVLVPQAHTDHFTAGHMQAGTLGLSLQSVHCHCAGATLARGMSQLRLQSGTLARGHVDYWAAVQLV